MAITVDGDPRPIFKPKEVREGDATLWCVEADWPDGTLDQIGRFDSAADAWRWIAAWSRAWFEARQHED